MTSPPPTSAATRRSILLLSFATFTSMVTQRICDAMLPELSRAFDVGLAQAAQVVSYFAVVYGAAQLVYGPLGDRLGKYRVIGWALLVCGAGSLLAVFSASLDLLVAARVVMALGAAAVIPLALAWIGDHLPFDQVQETLARVGLGTTLGIGAGQLIGGLLTETLGWRWAFAVLALLCAAVGMLLMADLRRQAVDASAAPPSPAGVRALARHSWSIVVGPWSRVVLLLAFLEGAAGFGVLALWASHLHRTLGLSLTAAGAIVALFGLGGMAYMASARRLIPRLGQPGLAQAGALLTGVCAIVLAVNPFWPLALAMSLLAGFGFFMFHNTMQANAAQMAPASRGTGVSLFAAALFLGQSAGALLGASLIEAVGSRPVVAGGGVVMLLLGFGFARVLRRRQQQAIAA